MIFSVVHVSVCGRLFQISSVIVTIGLGPFAFDETYQLRSPEPLVTLLTAKLRVWSTVPLVGSLIERAAGAPLAKATVRTSLQAIKRHCESD